MPVDPSEMSIRRKLPPANTGIASVQNNVVGFTETQEAPEPEQVLTHADVTQTIQDVLMGHHLPLHTTELRGTKTYPRADAVTQDAQDAQPIDKLGMLVRSELWYINQNLKEFGLVQHVQYVHSLLAPKHLTGHGDSETGL